jgi:hypothetical protein
MRHHPLFIFYLGLALWPLAAQTAVPTTNSPAAPSPPPAPAVTNAPAADVTAAADVAPPLSPAAASPAAPLPTAILKFQTSDDSMDKQGAEIAALLEADLSTSTHAILVERDEVEKILSEQEMGASGLVSADTAAKIGSLTGAKVLVTGRLFAVGNQFMVVAKIISTETSRVYGVTATIPDLGNLSKAAQDLSGKIDDVLGTHRDVLVVQEETSEQRIQRLKDLLGDRALPSVIVTVTERDYGTQPAIDPAAETEIKRDLLQLGFHVIDAAEGRRKADITITGEGFSELGSRHGNLVSSRGRLELRAVRTVSGELLWIDRETQVAVDVGDHTAGKTALQNAAEILTERMLPKLTK